MSVRIFSRGPIKRGYDVQGVENPTKRKETALAQYEAAHIEFGHLLASAPKVVVGEGVHSREILLKGSSLCKKISFLRDVADIFLRMRNAASEYFSVDEDNYLVRREISLRVFHDQRLFTVVSCVKSEVIKVFQEGIDKKDLLQVKKIVKTVRTILQPLLIDLALYRLNSDYISTIYVCFSKVIVTKVQYDEALHVCKTRCTKKLYSTLPSTIEAFVSRSSLITQILILEKYFDLIECIQLSMPGDEGDSIDQFEGDSVFFCVLRSIYKKELTKLKEIEKIADDEERLYCLSIAAHSLVDRLAFLKGAEGWFIEEQREDVMPLINEICHIVSSCECFDVRQSVKKILLFPF